MTPTPDLRTIDEDALTAAVVAHFAVPDHLRRYVHEQAGPAAHAIDMLSLRTVARHAATTRALPVAR